MNDGEGKCILTTKSCAEGYTNDMLGWNCNSCSFDYKRNGEGRCVPKSAACPKGYTS
jgi:hypothetical protein